ncbi:MAG: M20/M25/M40 family metallo-hydrolase [Alphaproteobacteria bacterium]|nr:M20/M25/M40 family metallo-hydrolase [Alphaproteobacteria bacterium]
MSAIEKIPAVIQALLGLERAYNSKRNDDPMEKGRMPFSLVIGKIAGGHYETVTAGDTTIKGGAYFAPATGDIVEIMDGFRKAVAEANEGDEFLREHPAKIEFLHHDDSTRQSPQLPLARYLGEVLSKEGGNGTPVPGPFCCDMRHLVNQGNIPTVIFGPGTIAQAHKPDEHIQLAEYLESIDYLIRFIGQWCNESRDSGPAIRF